MSTGRLYCVRHLLQVSRLSDEPSYLPGREVDVRNEAADRLGVAAIRRVALRAADGTGLAQN